MMSPGWEGHVGRRRGGKAVHCFVSFLVTPQQVPHVSSSQFEPKMSSFVVCLDSCIFIIYFQLQYNCTLTYFVFIVPQLWPLLTLPLSPVLCGPIFFSTLHFSPQVYPVYLLPQPWNQSYLQSPDSYSGRMVWQTTVGDLSWQIKENICVYTAIRTYYYLGMCLHVAISMYIKLNMSYTYVSNPNP